MSLLREPVSDEEFIASLRRRGQPPPWPVVLAAVFLIVMLSGIVALLPKIDSFFDDFLFSRSHAYTGLAMGFLFGGSLGMATVHAVQTIGHALGWLRLARAERLLLEYYDQARPAHGAGGLANQATRVNSP